LSFGVLLLQVNPVHAVQIYIQEVGSQRFACTHGGGCVPLDATPTPSTFVHAIGGGAAVGFNDGILGQNPPKTTQAKDLVDDPDGNVLDQENDGIVMDRESEGVVQDKRKDGIVLD